MKGLRAANIGSASLLHLVSREVARTDGLPWARSGPPYFSCTEPDEKGIMTAEVGIPVDRAGATAGRVEPGVLPGGDVATAYYLGPYETLGVAYRQLWSEIEAAGLTPNGHPREVYVTAPRATPDPEDYGTHLVWPVRG